MNSSTGPRPSTIKQLSGLIALDDPDQFKG